MGVPEFSLKAAHALRRAVPFDGVCVLTLDPATLLPTGHVIENGLPPATARRYSEIEIREPDFNKLSDLARAPRPAASLSAATKGELDLSLRHRELRSPSGFGDELRSVLVSDARAWGGIVLLRERGRPDFTPAETRLLAACSPHLAEGLRRAVLVGEIVDGGDEDGAPGLVLLGDDGAVEDADAAGRGWLDELRVDESDPPVAVRTVANRAREVASGSGGGHARARVRTPAGRWLLVRGSMLGGRTAVIIEPVRSPDLTPLIADAYGLTPRERLVTALVAQGLPTDAIAHRLHLSAYTIQDHLKAIFEKVDVGSRGELVARLYFEYYGGVGLEP